MTHSLPSPAFGRPVRRLAALAAGLLLCASAQALNLVNTTAWTAAYQGIDLATATVNTSQAFAARVDLQADGIAFTSTAKAGSLDTRTETTSAFLLRTGAELAVNTGFFTPCCTTTVSDVDLRGLAVSDGQLVSAPTYGSARSVGTSVLLLTAGNQASIGVTTSAAALDWSLAYNALAGSGVIVRNGANVSASHGTFGAPTVANPRTVLGISQDARYLYLVAIEGRQAGYSDGVTMDEAADLMIALGAGVALNADGGGSTAMVLADDLGGALLMNRPSGGSERWVGSNLGVQALALSPVPEPATAWMLAAGLLLGWRLGRRAGRQA